MNDLKFAIRQLLKNPGFTAVAVLTLALGIGACSSIFSMLDALVPATAVSGTRLPRPNPRDVAGRFAKRLVRRSLSDWREHHPGFDSVALINPVTRNLRDDGAPERLNGLEATHEFLDVLRVQPLLGRGFMATEDQPGR